MKIYTKGGDRGVTSLLGGTRVPKDDPRIEAYGTIDELIMSLSKQLRITSVVVTHNMQSVFRIADRATMVHRGRIVEVGSLLQIKNSQNQYVKQFIDASPEGPIDFLKQDTDIVEEFSLLKRRCP